MKINVKQFREDVELVTKLKIVNEIFLSIFPDELNDYYVSQVLDAITEKLEEVTDYVEKYYLKRGN